MATFPVLKTGAVAQYPLGLGLRYSTQVVRFMDGSQQKFRLIGVRLRRWNLKLDLLDEQELGALIAFVEQQGSQTFPFTDPFTGEIAENCVIYREEFDATMNSEMSGQTAVVIEEIA